MPITEFDAASGHPAESTTHATQDAPPPFARLPLHAIVASRTNPRKSFGAAKLQELADSIRALGVMQPILVRPLPGDRLQETTGGRGARAQRPAYEIVSGERRFRASQMAQVDDIPAMIRPMSDQQVLEAQLVENLQRDDLHPLEEAEGYRRLCEATGISKDEIAGKIGKGRTYVYNRLKLLDLAPESCAAFQQGLLDTSRAELLATVADPKLQLKALKEFAAEGYRGRRMSVRECSAWLQDNILLKIKEAPFDTKHTTLLATSTTPGLQGTGACTTCPKRTHADRDLFAAFDGPDMCTDPVCYRAKEAAHLAIIKADAQAKGMEVIAGAEAKKLKSRWGDEIKGYTRLDEKPRDGDGTTVAKLLGKDAPTPILFVDPATDRKIRVLPTDVVDQVLKDKGVVATTTNQREKDRQRAIEADRAKQQLEEEMLDRAAAAVATGVGQLNAYSAAFLRYQLARMVNHIGDTTAKLLLQWWHLPAGDDYWTRSNAVQAHVQAAPDEAIGHMLLHTAIANDAERAMTLQDATLLQMLAGECGINVDAIRAEVKAEHKAARKAAKDPAPPGATVQAAPQGAAPQEGGKAAGKGKRAAAAAAKLSAQQAQQGIADAMQSVDPTSGVGVRPPVGARVKFLQDVRYLGKLRLVNGLEGEVVEHVGDRALSIQVKGIKQPNPITADYTEVQLVDAEAEAAV